MPGIAALPLACRPGIGAAKRLYAAIGHRVAEAGGNSMDRRTVVPLAGKLALLGRSMASAVAAGGDLAAPPVEQARHLVAAVVASPAPGPKQAG